MLRIKFEVTTFPRTDQMEYLQVYVEGILQVFVGNHLFFNQRDITLVEFAIFVRKWMNNVSESKNRDFAFNSMDHGEPIMSFNYVEDDRFKFQSIWQEKECIELITIDDILHEFQLYLIRLYEVLKFNLGIDLKLFLEENQME